jgi:hypothetical protein
VRHDYPTRGAFISRIRVGRYDRIVTWRWELIVTVLQVMRSKAVSDHIPSSFRPGHPASHGP